MKSRFVSLRPANLAIVYYADGRHTAVETYKPRVIEDRDVILKVTGSTICGSDLHLLHGSGNNIVNIHRNRLIWNHRYDCSTGERRYSWS